MNSQLLIDTVVQQVMVLIAQPGSSGGSTYGFDIWPGHPLESEVMGLLASFRTRCGELRTRVEEHNGSCAIERGMDQGQHEDE